MIGILSLLLGMIWLRIVRFIRMSKLIRVIIKIVVLILI